LKKTIIILSILTPLFCSAQGILTGTVTDEETNRPIEQVNISLVSTLLGDATDKNGRFRISDIPAGDYNLQASCIGFETLLIENIKISDEGKELEIKLSPTVISLPGVRVEADRFDPHYRSELARADVFTLKARNVYRTAGAMDDISRAVQLQTSVAPGGDYTSFYAVRGGSPDQNIVMMDGLLFPNPYRLRLVLGGGLSVFNPNTVSDVNLQVGHFSAEYGDFMSSVLGVESRSGRIDRIGFGGNINVLNANVFAEGPLLRSGGSWIASARRTYFDLLAEQYDDGQTAYPMTQDYTVKFVLPLHDRHRLELKSLHSREEMEMNSEDFENVDLDESAGIDLYALTYKGLWSDNAYETINIAVYDELFDYHIQKKDGYDKTNAGYDSKIRTVMIKEDLSIELGENHLISRGFYYSTMQSNMDYFADVNEIAFSRRVLPPAIEYSQKHNQLAAYLDYTAKITPKFQTRVGVRYDYSSLIDKENVSPRVSLMYKLAPGLSINGFWGVCYQYPNVMSIFNRDWPLALDKVEKDLTAERAEHRILGVKWRINNLISAQMDIYDKKFDDLLLPGDFQSFIPNNDGEGYSRGIEVSLQTLTQPEDRWHAMLSYSLSKSEYKIMDQWIPYLHDRRHGLTAMGDARLSQHWSTSLTWRYASGLPFYEIHQFIDVSDIHNSFIKNFDNLKRLPHYQRLDIRFNYKFAWKALACSAYLDLTNVLNRKNVYDVMWYSLKENDESDRDIQIKSLYRRNIFMMPFVPMLGVSFRF
jgi:hypothetical protein